MIAAQVSADRKSLATHSAKSNQQDDESGSGGCPHAQIDR